MLLEYLHAACDNNNNNNKNINVINNNNNNKKNSNTNSGKNNKISTSSSFNMADLKSKLNESIRLKEEEKAELLNVGESVDWLIEAIKH